MPDVLTADGQIIRLSPVQASDAEQLQRLYREAGERSRYLRFFSLGRAPIDQEVTRLTRAFDPDHHAVIAYCGARAIGVASYERLPNPAQADFAVLVADDWHGRGVGTLLLEQLAGHARQHGIRELLGDVLPMNTTMLKVAGSIASDAIIERGQDIDVVRIGTHFDDSALDAVLGRELVAEEHSLRPLLAPRSVAVVAEGGRTGEVGWDVLYNIVDHRFAGNVYAVSPTSHHAWRHRVYSRLSALPEAVDLVIMAVSADMVAEVLAEAGHIGARAAAMLAPAFSPTSPNPATSRQEMVRVARAHGLRLLGPNSLGLINNDPSIRLAAFASLRTRTESSPPPPAGGLAVATQSGAVGIAVLDHAARANLGVSTLVSLGDKADISGNDMLSYWFDDPLTRAVALYLESFGNPRKFARVARAVGRRKPVLAVKGGRLPGQAQVQTQSGEWTAAVTPDAVIDSLFAQAGVIRAANLAELIDVARILIDQPLPAGNRVGLVGNTGGLNVLAADAASVAGLVVPDITVAGGNAVDVGSAATAEELGRAVRRMASSGAVDAMLVSLVATRIDDSHAVVRAIGDAVDGFSELTVAVVMVGFARPPTHVGRRRAPVYSLPEPAIQAVGQAVRYAQWRRQPLGNRPHFPDLNEQVARSIVDKAIATSDPDGAWQPRSVAVDLLACYGIPVRSVNEPEHGVELIAGVVHDPLFGSLLMLGPQGLGVDMPAERYFQLVPLTDTDAAGLWRRLPAARRLAAERPTHPDVDTASLDQLLLRLGQLAEDLPEVAELRLDPLLVLPDGVRVVDVKVRIRPVSGEPDAVQRVLRDG